MDSENIGRARRPKGRSRGTQPQTLGSSEQQSGQAFRPPRGGPPFRPPMSGPRQSRPYAQEQQYSREADASQLPREMENLRVGTSVDVVPVNVGGGEGAAFNRGSYRSGKFFSSKILVTRPGNVTTKTGTTGLPVDLQANYFKMITRPNWTLYHYHVDFDPPIDLINLRKKLLFVHKVKLGGYLFDGSSLWTTNSLGENNEKLEFISKKMEGDTVRIIVKFVGGLEQTDYHYIQVYNIIIKKCLSELHLQLVGRNYYDAGAKVVLHDHSLELWPGYETSIRQKENDLLMSVDIRSKVMRMETVLEVIQALRDGSQGSIRNALIGCTILTDYNNRTYRIDDIDFKSTPFSEFQYKREGRNITFFEYYQKNYRINIRNRDQPLLVIKTKPREQRAGQPDHIKLVPEICRMMGLTDRMRSNFNTMKALAVHTRIGPRDRIDRLLQFNRKMTDLEGVGKILKEWNMKLDQRLIRLNGRELPIESIVFGNSKSSNYQNSDWTKNLREAHMAKAAYLENWIVITHHGSERDVNRFISTLQNVAGKMNFKIQYPQIVAVQDRKEEYSYKIQEVFKTTNPQMIMTIVPNNRADRYSVIKRMCYVEIGVPSQVVLIKNATSKGVMSIATKIAIQMNVKLGGAPWVLPIPLTGLMIVGFDVCHDIVHKQKSYGATVASIDTNLSRYYSCVSEHVTGVELSDNLASNISKAIHKYSVINNALPKQIIVYRDGVGEGQLPYVFQQEVLQVKTAIREIYEKAGEQFKFAFIVVTKQIASRFFTASGDNPNAGTVIDDVVTDPNQYDFFLVSQSVNQGTVSPTHYNVLDDNTTLDADKMQRLAYKLTHLYYNWSGTIRVPAPCQFAHKLAFLTSQSLHSSSRSSLENVLYFL